MTGERRAKWVHLCQEGMPGSMFMGKARGQVSREDKVRSSGYVKVLPRARYGALRNIRQPSKGFSEQPWTQSLSLLVNFSHQLIFSSVLLSVLESLMMEHYGRLLKAVGHRGNQSRIKRCQRFRFNDSAHSSWWPNLNGVPCSGQGSAMWALGWCCLPV